MEDTGCGIDKDIQNRIFDPFFTTKPLDEGTGMGLASVHGIVKELDGAIILYSEKDKGTTFNVFIPVIAESSDLKERMPQEATIVGGPKVFFL